MTHWSKVLTSEIDDAKVDDGWQRVRARRGRPRIVRRALAAAPLLAVATLVFALARYWGGGSTTIVMSPVAAITTVAAAVSPPSHLPQRIALAGGTSLPHEWIVTEPRIVTLDDGSRLELAANARLATGEGASDRVDLIVERGRVTFDVKPHGPRAWVIDAGPVVVRVLGTRFTVVRDGSAVVVTVERGRVEVIAPEGTHILVAGQSFASGNAAPAAAAHLAPANPATAVSARPVDRMAHADALRQSGHPAEAVVVLRAVADGEDRRAPLAAFTIGKIDAEDLGDPASAARWFERAVALGLPVGLDEEALARAVECWSRAGSRADAARVAERYEARFPTGRHLARVREWSRD